MDQYERTYKKLTDRVFLQKRELISEVHDTFDQLRVDLCNNDAVLPRVYSESQNLLEAAGKVVNDYARKYLTASTFKRKVPELFGYYSRLLTRVEKQRKQIIVDIDLAYQDELSRLEQNYQKVAAQLELEGRLTENQSVTESVNLVSNPGKASALALMGEEVLDLVPTQIGNKALALSGHTEKYLLEYCARNALTARQLHAIIKFKADYETDLPTIERFMDRGRSWEEIQVLYSAREFVTGDEDPVNDDREISDLAKKGRASCNLESIDRFREEFCPGEMDPEFLADMINETHGRLQQDYVSVSIKRALDAAEELKISSLEMVLSVLDGSIRSDPLFKCVFHPGEDPRDIKD